MNEEYLQLSWAQRMLILIAVMTATIMQVLDTTIVNVALPYMQGSLGTTSDQITWTLTSYLVASAIFMPLTGYFADKLGRRNYLMISILGFTLFSALCGLATTLPQLVVFRLLQGIFGASLVPLAQAMMADIFPREQRTRAMAIWGFGVMIAPILGPTLGGYLTEYANWRWTFYINVPFGIFAAFLAWQVVPQSGKKERYMDWTGLLFLSLAIAALQYFLDRGNTRDWFGSWDIRIAAMLCVAGILSFIIHNSFKNERTVFDLSLFKDRNFTLGSILVGVMGLGLFGVMAIQPLMLEGIMNYPVLLAGLVMAPRGISGMLGMLFMGKYGQYIDFRYTMAVGVILNIIGVYFYTQLSLEMTPMWIIMPMLLQGFGISLIFTSLSTIAFSTLPAKANVEAAGLFSLLRTVGASIGISIVAAVYTRESQVAWNQLGGFMNPYNPNLHGYLDNLHVDLYSPLGMQILGNTLDTQSRMMGFIDAYVFVLLSFILMLALTFFIKHPARAYKPVAVESKDSNSQHD